MSNLLNFALGGLSGALTGSPLTALIGIPAAAATVSHGGTAGASAAASSPLNRDSQMPELGSLSSSVNLLSQAASLLSGAGSSAATPSADESMPSLPPLPPMPAPAKPAAVPTDDHGQSNIVFSDSDVDGALVH